MCNSYERRGHVGAGGETRIKIKGFAAAYTLSMGINHVSNFRFQSLSFLYLWCMLQLSKYGKLR